MIELTVIMALGGVLLVMAAFSRLRKFGHYRVLRSTIESQFDLSDLDLSGRTEYSDCFSHSWYVDYMRLKRHGRLGEWFQRQMMDRTETTYLWFAVILGSSAAIIGYLMLSLFRVLFAGLFVLLFTLILAVGSGGASISEQLLAALLKIKPTEYRRDDYPYVRIAMRQIMTWNLPTLVIGLILLVSAPFGTLLFDLLGTGIMVFGETFLWGPTFALFNIWAPLGVAYISLVIPFIFIIVPLGFYTAYETIRYKHARE
jgi:hypothetical protein